MNNAAMYRTNDCLITKAPGWGVHNEKKNHLNQDQALFDPDSVL